MKDSIERYVQRELQLRDRRRGRLDPDRRGAHAAHHLRPGRAVGRPVPEGRRDHPGLRKDIDYTVDEKAHSAILTDAGIERIEKRLGVGNLYDPDNIEWLHHVTQALRAHTLYKRDVNYLVEDGKVIIVDEFTGRKMPGRRWSDGLHQAIEAKEGVEIQEENQTLATISFQNYFRLYKKLARHDRHRRHRGGGVPQDLQAGRHVVPTNRPMSRKDAHDVVYKNERGKFRAVVDEIEDCHERGQPVLVGTVSVEKSEVVASLLRKKRHPAQRPERQAARERGGHRRAGGPQGRGHHRDQHGRPRHRHHPGRQRRVHGARRGRSRERRQARARAGARAAGRRTRRRSRASRRSATPRSRRCSAAGGLHILGTERHESRRIDNQLRGRAGRQGDPGSSRFYLSLEDDLMRIFGAERITGLMERLGMEEDVPIEHGLDQPRHRERAEEGRGAQLRHPQEPARVRRRDEPAAQDDLRAAPPDPRGALRARADAKRRRSRARPRPTRRCRRSRASTRRRAWRRRSRPMLARMCEALTAGAAPPDPDGARRPSRSSTVPSCSRRSAALADLPPVRRLSRTPPASSRIARRRSIAWPTRSRRR